MMVPIHALQWYRFADTVSYLVKRRRKQEQEATLTIRQVQAATASLDFLRQFAPLPVRITKIGRATAIEADVQVF